MAIKRSKIEVENKSTLPPDPFDDQATGNWRAELDATLDVFSLKNLYFSEPWVYIVCNIISRKISNQFMPVNKRKIMRGRIVTEPDPDHFLNLQLENPNEYEDYCSFMYKVATELTLMGNAVIWRLRFQKELMLLPTEMLDIKWDSNNRIESYMLNPGMTEETAQMSKQMIAIHPDDIIHIRLPNVNSMVFGLSPFVAGRKSILFDRYSSEYKNNFYLKQANPGLILEMDKEANEKQAFRFLKSMESLYTGRRSLRRTMMLPKGVKSVSHSQTLAEQDLKEHIMLNREEIRALLNLPPHELGLQSAGSMGSEESKTAIKNFWESTIIPFQGLIAGAFTHAFKKQLGAKHLFKFDNDDVKILKDDEKTKAEVANLKLSTHTVNEIRQTDYDMPPIEGGDKLPGSPSADPFAPFNFNREPPRLPPPVEEEPEEEELPEEVDASLGSTIFLSKHEEWWTKRKTAERKSADFAERKFMGEVLGMFSKLAPKVEKVVADNYQLVGGSTKDNNDIPSELDRAFGEFEEEYTTTGVRTLRGVGELGYDLQLDVPFNLPNREEIQALRERNEADRLAILEARQLRTFKNLGQTTTNDIVRIVQRGSENSLTLPQVSQEIQTYFKDIVPSRARTIARTETLTAVSLGQKAAQDDAKTLIPGIKKMWISAGDARVRDSHVDLDGKVVDVDADFKANLGYPRDTRASANEVINCRCSWLMIPPGDDLDDSGIDFTGV